MQMMSFTNPKGFFFLHLNVYSSLKVVACVQTNTVIWTLCPICIFKPSQSLITSETDGDLRFMVAKYH